MRMLRRPRKRDYWLALADASTLLGRISPADPTAMGTLTSEPCPDELSKPWLRSDLALYQIDSKLNLAMSISLFPIDRDQMAQQR